MAPDANGNGAKREKRMLGINIFLLSVVSIVLAVSTYQMAGISRTVEGHTELFREIPEKYLAIGKYERIVDMKDNDLKNAISGVEYKLAGLSERVTRNRAEIADQLRCILETLNKVVAAHERLSGRLESVFNEYSKKTNDH